MGQVLVLLATALCWGTSAHAQAGQLDVTFGNAGVAALSASVGSTINDIIVQPDGRIVMVGTVQVDGYDEALTMRLLPDGAMDPSFSSDGTTSIDVGVGSKAYSATTLSDGRIAVLCEVGGIDVAVNAAVVVYNSDGSVYSGFNGNGTMVLPIAQFFEACRIIATTDGGLLVTGLNDDALFMWKLHADGSLDTSFSFNGMASTNIPDHSGTTFFIPGIDGSFFACGRSGAPSLFAVHYLANGSLDTDFGTNGIANIPIGEDHDRFVGAHALADGRILMVLLAYDTDDGVDRLLMLRPDGSPDDSYGPGGVRSATADPTTHLDNSLFQPDGKLVLAGMKFYVEGGEEVLRPGLTRVDPFVLPDPQFGDQGTVSLDVSEFNVAEAPYFRPCALQPDGRILAVCSFHTGLSTQILVARYLNDLSSAVEEDGRSVNPLAIRYDPSADAIHVQLPPDRPTTQLRIHDARGALVRVVGTGSRNTVIIPLAAFPMASISSHRTDHPYAHRRSSSTIIEHDHLDP